jgi:hypothetical protein
MNANQRQRDLLQAENNKAFHDPKVLEEALIAVAEMQNQMNHDLGGEQREFYLPRMKKVFLTFTKLFPINMTYALTKATFPDGQLIWDHEE